MLPVALTVDCPHIYYPGLQVARTMAPSVIYIDEVEKVFVSDKKKAREFGGQVGDSARLAADGLSRLCACDLRSRAVAAFVTAC